MSNLQITFERLWPLLILIPSFAVALIPYFRLSKKYRRTRNRIISLVLHLIITLMAVFLLSGMKIEYKVANENNEIILLVDVSDTEEQVAETRDEFVNTVLSQSRFDNYKVGVVTFGFDQKYAVPLTYDVKSIYPAYIAADTPDRSATNIEDALVYTASLFDNPESAKIVLITDGFETDGKAMSVIRSIRSSGVNVDVAEIPSSFGGDDVRIVGVEKPDYHIGIDTDCSFTVIVSSSASTQITLKISDNETPVTTLAADLSEGENVVKFDCSFKTDGIHELVVEAEVNGDLFEQNNSYHTYVNIEVFNKILIIERNDGESATLDGILTEGEKFNTTVINVLSGDPIPETVDDLRQYDQIILCNIAHEDLPEGFDNMLYEYVNDYGGSMFTVGGDKDPDLPNSDRNAYSRDDLYGTVLQRMLPVSAIDYTPPLGVMVVVDTSGSMSANDGSPLSRLEWAREGAMSVMRSLSERDYFGLMTLDEDYNTVIPLTPRTQESDIVAAIESLQHPIGGTVFTGAIRRAGEALMALKNVDKRHIILVTDGEPSSEDREYENYIQYYYETIGITISIAMINSGNEEAERLMQRAADFGGGNLYVIKEPSALVRIMKGDLKLPSITEIEYEEFYPTIANITSPLVKDLGRNDAEGRPDQLDTALDGFYGVKIKKDADLILKGEYDVPIYAQWRFGKGMVGSLMVDVSGKFASGFLASYTGKTFIKNVVENLMPMENIRPTELSVKLRENNYTNNLSVYCDLQEGEKIVGRIEDIFGDKTVSLNDSVKPEEIDSEFYAKSLLGKENSYTRATFIIKRTGIYRIVLEKRGADDTVLSTFEMIKEFSYSAEYIEPTEEDKAVAKSTVSEIAEKGGGATITDIDDPYQIFEDFITVLDRVIDPTIFLAIASIVLFLLDICVRKFKFKWIHEIVRERKARQ